MKRIFARSKMVLEVISDFLIMVAPMILLILFQAILGDNFAVHAFGETIPLSLLGIPVQSIYIFILDKVYNLGKTSNERLKGVFSGTQKNCD